MSIHQWPVDVAPHRSDNGGMDGTDTRLTKLEARMDTILPTLATKTDIADTRTSLADTKGSLHATIEASKSDVIKWVAGTALGVVAIVVSVMAFMLNRIAPVQPATQPAPIIIQVPSLAPAQK